MLQIIVIVCNGYVFVLCVVRPAFLCIPLHLFTRTLLWCTCWCEQRVITAGPQIYQVTHRKTYRHLAALRNFCFLCNQCLVYLVRVVWSTNATHWSLVRSDCIFISPLCVLQLCFLITLCDVAHGFWTQWLGCAACLQTQIQTTVQQLG